MRVAVAGGGIPHSYLTLRPFPVLPAGMGASQALAKVLSQPGLSDIVKLVQVGILYAVVRGARRRARGASGERRTENGERRAESGEQIEETWGETTLCQLRIV
jgi:hypothetical protein